MWLKWEIRRRCIFCLNKEFLLYFVVMMMSIGSRIGVMLVVYDDMFKVMSDGVFGVWIVEIKLNEVF